LVFGVARFANAATGDVMAAGAYATLAGAAATGSLISGSILGIAAGALVGVASYLLVYRKLAGRSPATALLASIGVGFVLRAVITLLFGTQQKTFQLPLIRPWRILDVRIQPYDVSLVAVAVITLAITFFILHGTLIGSRMRAVADDPSLARISGISPG